MPRANVTIRAVPLPLAFQRGDGNGVAQRRLGHVDLHFEDDVVVVALEVGVRLDVERDVQISGRPTTLARLALPRQPDRDAIIDARGDGDFDPPPPVDPALTVTFVAWFCHNRALAVTTRAGDDIDERPQERPLRVAHLPRPATFRARLR